MAITPVDTLSTTTISPPQHEYPQLPTDRTQRQQTDVTKQPQARPSTTSESRARIFFQPIYKAVSKTIHNVEAAERTNTEKSSRKIFPMTRDTCSRNLLANKSPHKNHHSYRTLRVSNNTTPKSHS